MKLFFEGQQYDTNFLIRTFGEFAKYINIRENHSMTSLNVVGYFYNSDQEKGISETFFILPKVFVDGNGFAFNTLSINPQQAITLDDETIKLAKLHNWQGDLIQELPLWLYRAIEKFRIRTKEQTTIAQESPVQSLVASNENSGESTLLDIYLSLRHFYEENKNLFTFIYKQTHSGYNKINWTKTVRNSTPIIQGKKVVYPYVVNRKKVINYDEELLVLFFNTLQYLTEKFSERFTIDQPFNLVPKNIFSRNVTMGVVYKQLLRIKNKYFNDKLITLWKLLHIFYSKNNKILGNKRYNEYLMVHNFNIIFEDMIDYLLGDSEMGKEIQMMKNQDDGKIVDHLFKADSLTTRSRQIYYIGDSKYYKESTSLSPYSIFKQHTYARNIVQKEIDWYYGTEQEHKKYLNYRDEETEGYNITPNFFISGKVDDSYITTKPYLKNTGEEFPMAFQFKNRIFDRDTLFLQKYDINFMFVLYAYVAEISFSRQSFKKDAQELFRGDFTTYLNSKFKFYIIIVKEGFTFDEVMDKHFRRIIGKVFRPYLDKKNLAILGLEKADNTNDALVKSIKDEFWIYKFALGESANSAIYKEPINERI